MKEELKILWYRLKLNPLHLILGFLLITVGTTLLIDDSFFYWPPELQWFFNNDLVDALAIVIGTGSIAFVCVGGKNQMANAILLAASAFFIAMLIVLEIGHILFMHDYSRLLLVVFVFSWILVIQYMATHSRTIKRRK